MPTYRFLNTKTGEEYEDLMSISEMEKHKRQKHIELLPPNSTIKSSRLSPRNIYGGIFECKFT